VWPGSRPAAAQSPAPLSLDDYRAELFGAIVELESAPADQIEGFLLAQQERFAAINQVQLPTREVVNVLSILSDLNVEANPSVARGMALARMKGAVIQIDAAATDNTLGRLEVLETILARPEFNAPQSLWDRFLQWLDNWLNELLPDAQTAARSGWLAWLIRVVPWIVSIVIVAAVIWLLSHWLQRLLAAFVTDARIKALAGEDDLPATAAEARQQARAAADSGHYRDAVRRLYLAALLQLAEHDLITYERSLTNREVLVRVPADSPVRSHLEPVIATFDQVWYGVREPDQATFNAYEAEIDALASVAAGARREARQGETP
jgi:hypothetical protein